MALIRQKSLYNRSSTSPGPCKYSKVYKKLFSTSTIRPKLNLECDKIILVLQVEFLLLRLHLIYLSLLISKLYSAQCVRIRASDVYPRRCVPRVRVFRTTTPGGCLRLGAVCFENCFDSSNFVQSIFPRQSEKFGEYNRGCRLTHQERKNKWSIFYSSSIPAAVKEMKQVFLLI